MINLNNVKVGDTLQVTSTHSSCIEVVAKVHKLHVVTEAGHKFRKCDGTMVGSDSWYYRFAKPITESEIKEQQRIAAERKMYYALVKQCKAIEFTKLSADKLRQILTIANY